MDTLIKHQRSWQSENRADDRKRICCSTLRVEQIPRGNWNEGWQSYRHCAGSAWHTRSALNPLMCWSLTQEQLRMECGVEGIRAAKKACANVTTQTHNGVSTFCKHYSCKPEKYIKSTRLNNSLCIDSKEEGVRVRNRRANAFKV